MSYKNSIAGVYLEDEDEEYDDPPITSGSDKSSHPIKLDVFKNNATIFWRSFSYCIPASLKFNEIDEMDKDAFVLVAVRSLLDYYK